MGKKKDATDKGVSEEVEGDAPEKEIEKIVDEEKIEETITGTGHSEALEAIAENVKKEHHKEAGIEEDEPKEESEEEGEEKLGDEKEEPESEKEEDSEEIEEKPTEDEQVVELVVDGEKKEVPLSEIVDAGKRTLQKESAADKRLEEATKLLKEAKETQQPKEEIEEKEEEPKEDAEARIERTRQKLAEAIQYGDEEEIAKAQKEHDLALRSDVRRYEDGGDTSDISEKIREEIKAETVRNRLNEPKDQGGFKDLLEDARAKQLFISEIDKALDSGLPNEWETYRTAGEEIRKFLGWDKLAEVEEKEDTKEPTNALQEKQEKKRSVDHIEPVNAKTETTLEKEKPLSKSEIIENMRKNRPGQHIY